MTTTRPTRLTRPSIAPAYYLHRPLAQWQAALQRRPTDRTGPNRRAG